MPTPTADIPTPADKPLSSKFLFLRYSNRTDYEVKTGRVPPPFDPAKRPKYWEDPTAINMAPDEYCGYTVLATNSAGAALTLGDGSPYTRQLGLSATIAAAVNIPPNVANVVEGASLQEYPTPLAALKPNEVLLFDKVSLGQVMVRDLTAWGQWLQSTNDTNPSVTSADRALWRAIANKLGV